MITFINKVAIKLQRKNYFFKRFFGILTDNLWVNTIVFYKFDLDKIDLARKHEKIEVRWKLATKEDCEKWFTGEPDAFPVVSKKRFLQLIENGDWVLLGERISDSMEPKPVTHAACAFRQKPMTHSVDFRVQNLEGFIMAVFTDNEMRGQGLAAGCIAEICRKAKEAGKQVVYIDISTTNFPSIRSAEKVGAIPCDTRYILFRILKRSFIFPFGSLSSRFEKNTNLVKKR